MKRLALVSFLALGTALGGTAASAATANTGVVSLGKAQSGLELVKYKRHGRAHRHHRSWRHHRNWRHHGYRHNRYRGWHRYHHRPWNWRTRGCVIVGPVWLCP